MARREAPVREITQESVESGERLHPLVADVIQGIKDRKGKTAYGRDMWKAAERGSNVNDKDRKPYDEEQILLQELATQLYPVDKLDPHVVRRAKTILDERASPNGRETVVATGGKRVSGEISDEEVVDDARAIQMRAFLEHAAAAPDNPYYALEAIKTLAGYRVGKLTSGEKYINMHGAFQTSSSEAIAEPEQLRASDAEVVDAYNTFKAFLDLKGQRMSTDNITEAELKKVFPNVRWTQDGMAYEAGADNDERKANIAAAERDYLMTREKFAERLKSEIGNAEPMTENQLRDRLKELERENKELQTQHAAELKEEQDRTKEAERREEEAERKAGVSEQRAQMTATETGNSVKAAEERARTLEKQTQDKLRELQALLGSAGLGNRGKVINEAQSAIEDLLRSLQKG